MKLRIATAIPNVIEKISSDATPNVVRKNSESVRSVTAYEMMRFVLPNLLIAPMKMAESEKQSNGAAARIDS